jgi:hypothetical protein
MDPGIPILRSRSDAPDSEQGRCPECGVLYGEGRWGWGGGTPGAHAERCASCGRVHDVFPPGDVMLSGPIFAKRRKEVLDRIVLWGKLLAKEHPARRIEAVQVHKSGVMVKTNDARLARRIGDALCNSFGGKLEYRYPHPANTLHVLWTG